jgi:hypothetical protein
MTYNVAGGQTYTLASSISSTDTTMTLSSFLEPVSGVPYTMLLLNTDIVYATIAPRTAQSEFISFTGITQNVDGTATLTGVVRGLAKKYPFTASATFRLPHSGQSQFILSDAPQLFNKKGTLENDEEITGYWEAPDPVTAQGLVTRDYMLNLINGGPIAVNNVVDNLAVAGEDVTAGQLVYQNTTDSKWYLTDADTAATVQYKQLGLTQGAGATDASITDGVLKYGVDTTLTGTTGLVYASNTAGGLSTSTGTVERVVGMYLANNAGLLFDPYFFYTLTNDLKDAMAGGGDFGTPSTSNKFLTEDFFDVEIAKLFNSGTTTKNTANDTTTTIAHGLGRIPKRVYVVAVLSSESLSTNFSKFARAEAIYTTTGGFVYQSVAMQAGTATSSNGSYSQTYSTFTLLTNGAGGVNENITGVITVDATNITITWTRNDSGGTAKLLWEAQS